MHDDAPPSFPDLKGASVLITGGGSGIGAALTEGFARQGAKVAFIDIAEAPSKALADRIEKEARRAAAVPEDRPSRHRGAARGDRTRPPKRMATSRCWSTTPRSTTATRSRT